MKIFLLTLFILTISEMTVAQPQFTQEWVRNYTEIGNSTQSARDIACDASGNIYVTGLEQKGYSGNDMMTLKYSASGELQWARSYYNQSISFSSESGKFIKTYQNSGVNYVYASGEVAYSGYTNYVITIKYDENGNVMWNRAAYVGHFNTSLTLKSMFVDGSGNCYITGGSGTRIFLVKYDSLGLQVFSTFFENPSGYHTGIGNDVKVTPGGEIFVAGNINNGSTNKYILLKYSAGGSLLYHRILSTASYPHSVDCKLNIGASGNLYVCGKSNYGLNDFFMIKYNYDGDTLWTRRYNGTSNASDIFNDSEIDNAENVYMTGIVNGLYGDAATIKYDSAGNLQWVRTFAGSGGWADEGKDIEIDQAGNVCVAGYSEFSVGQKYLLLKYDNAGNNIWTREYDFIPSDYESAVAAAIDNSGNLIATGDWGYPTTSDFGTVKLDPSGNKLWSRNYNYSQVSTDAVNSIANDKAGNVYAVGKVRTAGHGDNIALVKYNAAGTLKWTYNRGSFGLLEAEDAGNAVAVDRNGYVYLTGCMTLSFAEKKDIFTMKLDSNGTPQWPLFVEASAFHLNDEGFEIGVDSSGNVYVGYDYEVAADNINFGVIKYNSSGTKLWTYAYAGGSNDTDLIRDMKVDNSGSVYLTGITSTASNNRDIVTIKVNSTGIPDWINYSNGTANGDDDARAIETDNDGNVYVAGSLLNTGTGYDITVTKYSGSGSTLWTYSRSNGTNLKESGVVIKYDTINSSLRIAGDAETSVLYNSLAPFVASVDSAGISSGEVISNPAQQNSYVYGGILDAAGLLVHASGRGTALTGADTRVWRQAAKFVDFNGSSSANDYPAVNGAVATLMNSLYVGVSSFDSTFGYRMSIVKYKMPVYQLNLDMFIQGSYDPDFGFPGIMVQDTVRIKLRSATPPYAIVDSAKTVCSFEGNAYLVPFLNITGSNQYYVTVNHRNSIETWSKTPLTFSPGYLSVDFTDTSGVFGDNVARIDSIPVLYGLFSGDTNQDGTVDATDLSAIDNDAQNFVGGYIVTDLTGDDFVDGTDFAIADNNAANFVSVVRP